MNQLSEGVKDLHDQDELAWVEVFRGRQAEQFHTLTKEKEGKCLADLITLLLLCLLCLCL